MECVATRFTRKPSKYWESIENIHLFFLKLKQKYNLNNPEDWNSITQKHIKANGGSTLFKKYSVYELKCIACPEGKTLFNNPPHHSKYWTTRENIDNFLSKIKQKYNLNTPEDWNSITQDHITSNGGWRLIHKYSMYEIKCMACPEGKSIFNNPPGYWENEENIRKFLSKIREKYNLHTIEDWNLITMDHIRSNGGSSLCKKYSMYDIKSMACPEGKLTFDNPPGYWENKENVNKFLLEIKQKYNLNTPKDWNKIKTIHITSNGGWSLLKKYSIYELKCMACPEGKLIFNIPPHPPGYWENMENIYQFLSKIKQEFNLSTPEDWNLITKDHFKASGGISLLNKYSMYELKCMACPEGKSMFTNPLPPKYWENKENVSEFLLKLKQKYELNTTEDWKRISRNQIVSEGGWGLLYSNNYFEIEVEIEGPNKTKLLVPLSKLISGSAQKRSSQRWLFLQVQKLFPDDEIVEDYFHSEISRISGANVQFDIFMIERSIAIEYHGKQHYEDIPANFGSLEIYQYRDFEKEKLCKQHNISLLVIPYWWDNKLDSLRTFLYSKIKI